MLIEVLVFVSGSEAAILSGREAKMKKKTALNTASSLGILSVLVICGPGWAGAQEQFLVPADPPRAQYRIDASIELIDHRLIVGSEGTVEFTNTLPKPLSLIAIDWQIDPFHTIEVKWKGQPVSLLNRAKGSPEVSPLIYELPSSVPTGQKVRLDVQFSKIVGGDVKDETNLRVWYPRLWWEGIATKDSFRVKLKIPRGYDMALSGRLNKKTGTYDNDAVTTCFGILLTKNMQKLTEEVEGVLISSFYRKGGEEAARFLLETAADVVKFYKDWHGFYPNTFLTILPGFPEPGGGYPYASGIVVIHGQEGFSSKPLLHWKGITAHEIAHQYWGEYIMSGDYPYDYRESWLMIGLGMYADREYSFFREQDLSDRLETRDRYLLGVQRRYDTTEDAPESVRENQRYNTNNILIHGKGFYILSALESVLGRPTFLRIYLRSARDHGGMRLGYREFWGICERESGENLAWFFESWVRSSRYLSGRIVSQKSEKKGTIYVSAVCVESALDSIRMPLPIKAFFEDGTSQIQWTNRLFKTNEIRFESRSRLKSAVLDPDDQLAMLENPLPVLPEKVPSVILRLKRGAFGKEAREMYEAAKTSQVKDPEIWYRLGILLFDSHDYEEAFDAFGVCLELKPAEDYRFVALVRMGQIKDLGDERQKAIEYYSEALKYEGGYSLQFDPFEVEINRQWVRERLELPYKQESLR
jgi:tetratricopeptide (TPR) repeat protein